MSSGNGNILFEISSWVGKVEVAKAKVTLDFC